MSETLHHRLAVAVNDTPGFLTRDYVRVLQGDKDTVGRLMQKLRAHGFIRPEKVAGSRNNVVTWWPTPALKAKLASRQPITLSRCDPAANDDNWTPQPWVHPIRARSLGASPSPTSR